MRLPSSPEAGAASKAALAALTRSMAAEGRAAAFASTPSAPAPVPETLMSQQLGKSLAERAGTTPEQILESASEGIVQGRPQTAAEIAAAAVFLVSDQASAIIGQIPNVGGGMAFC
jgi:meso-butanediol dehydrogenase/(S,S)-butanediol dehydrogenase/diacetyl reductase